MIIYYHAYDNFLSKRKNHLKKDFQTTSTSFLLIKSKTYQGESSFQFVGILRGKSTLYSGMNNLCLVFLLLCTEVLTIRPKT